MLCKWVGSRFTLALMALTLVSIGCTTGYCRKSFRDADKETKTQTKAETLFIYKYDGSLQCKMGQPVALKEMAKELKGLKVYSQEKRHDGLMHVQVCGSITGRANVYEIEKKDLPEAVKRKFKVWNF